MRSVPIQVPAISESASSGQSICSCGSLVLFRAIRSTVLGLWLLKHEASSKTFFRVPGSKGIIARALLSVGVNLAGHSAERKNTGSFVSIVPG